MGNLLYTIKDDYGSEMSWLQIMLGTWHLMKDYLNVFLKKYENTFVRHLLSKVLSKGNIDAVVACTSWIKSHNYTNWMMAAFFRENIQNFIDNLTDNDNDDMINEFNQKADRAVQILETKEDTIEESVIKFLELRGTLHELFDSFKGRYESFMDHG